MIFKHVSILHINNCTKVKTCVLFPHADFRVLLVEVVIFYTKKEGEGGGGGGFKQAGVKSL